MSTAVHSHSFHSWKDGPPFILTSKHTESSALLRPWPWGTNPWGRGSPAHCVPRINGNPVDPSFVTGVQHWLRFREGWHYVMRFKLKVVLSLAKFWTGHTCVNLYQYSRILFLFWLGVRQGVVILAEGEAPWSLMSLFMYDGLKANWALPIFGKALIIWYTVFRNSK